MERLKTMSLLQKVSRYVELFNQGKTLETSVETEALGTISASYEGLIDELVAARSATNGEVARVPAKATKAPAKRKAVASSKATSVSDTAGRGKKECPGCKKFVGARAQTCPNCKHVFETAISKPAADTADNAEKSVSQGRRAKGESLSDKLVEILQDAANDGRRKEPSLDLTEVLTKLVASGYQTTATEKNLRVSVQARLGELVKKGVVMKSEDRKYSVKVVPADAPADAPAAAVAPVAQSA